MQTAVGGWLSFWHFEQKARVRKIIADVLRLHRQMQRRSLQSVLQLGLDGDGVLNETVPHQPRD